MISEAGKRSLRLIGAQIRDFGNEIEDVDPNSKDYFLKMNALYDSIEKLVKTARGILIAG